MLSRRRTQVGRGQSLRLRNRYTHARNSVNSSLILLYEVLPAEPRRALPNDLVHQPGAFAYNPLPRRPLWTSIPLDAVAFSGR